LRTSEGLPRADRSRASAKTGTQQAAANGRASAALARGFVHPPDASRIMVRWWWFGPAVTKPEIARELRAMKAAGVGGVEMQATYPLALDNPATGIKNLPYLSDAYLDALRYANAQAHALGLRLDLTLGSGWPYGGPSVPVTEAAGALRTVVLPVAPEGGRVALPAIAGGETLLATFLAPGTPGHVDASAAREMADTRDGAVLVPPGTGARVLLVFIASRTGQTVKRAAVGAEGFVVDHYDRAAVDHYLHNVGDRLMQAFGDQPPYAVFCDSLEVYGSDWTPDLLEQFRRRRGYDLTPFLPLLLTGGAGAEKVRHDWGETLTELFNERFLAPMEEWARRHGTRFRVQAYGTPPAALSSYAGMDLPEGEGWQWREFTPTRWASSASHVYGNPIASSETWTWLHSPAFRATPLDMKAAADLYFLEGSNQLVAHGWPYSPASAGEPGWRFYAAGAFNPHNPWWPVMPDLTRYLQRVSYLLRQGQPVNAVAVYLPSDDAWAQFRPGSVSLSETLATRLGTRLLPAILDAGENFDFVDDGALDSLVRGGRLRARYRVIVLPDVGRIPLATYQNLAAFVADGGRLIATHRMPSRGRSASGAEAAAVTALSQRLLAGAAQLVPNAEGLAVALDAAGSKRDSTPDVRFTPAAPEIGFVHRHTPEAEIYFLANTGNRAQHVQATFRVTDGWPPEVWDPLTGTVALAQIQPGPPQTTELALPAYGSQFVVFRRSGTATGIVTTANKPRERVGRPRVADATTLDLSSDWQVTFAGTGRHEAMSTLHSWADDAATRYYSGEAFYEKTITLSAAMLQPGTHLTLSLGDAQPLPVTPSGPGTRAWLEGPVREAAVVFINGVRAGSVWCPPYTLDVTSALHAGRNTLRLEVGNTAINEMAGRPLPDDRLLHSRYGVRAVAQDVDHLEALPSGLLGPVRLVGDVPPAD